jgi:hypothetical protein
MKIYHIQIPLGELGVPQRGIVPPLEAHRERSEHSNFRRNCVRLKEVFGV